MQLREPIPSRRMVFDVLTTACLVVTAWTLGTAVGSHHVFERHMRALAAPAALSASASAPVDAIPARVVPAEQRVTPTNAGGDPSIEHPKRGIRPPWRENAIPELRRQPGHKAKAAAA